MLTSAQFRAQNTILLDAPILIKPKVKTAFPIESAQFGDSIDLNGDGSLDHRITMKSEYLTKSCIIDSTEPQLMQNFVGLKRQALGLNKAVLTELDIQAPRLANSFHVSVELRHPLDTGVNYATGAPKISSKGQTTLNQFVDDWSTTHQGAFGAKWALDFDSNSFLIYRPKD